MLEAQEWQLQDAKNRFSELVKRAQFAPQAVTVHGKPSAVVISFDEYRSLMCLKQTLPQIMKSAPKGFADLNIQRDSDEDIREVGL